MTGLAVVRLPKGARLRLRAPEGGFGAVREATEDGATIFLWPSAKVCRWTWEELAVMAAPVTHEDQAVPSCAHWNAVEMIGRLFSEGDVDQLQGTLRIPHDIAAAIVQDAKRAMEAAEEARYLAPAVALLRTCPPEGMLLYFEEADELAEAVGIERRLSAPAADLEA